MHKFKLNYFPRGFNNTYINCEFSQNVELFQKIQDRIFAMHACMLCYLLSIVADAGESDVYLTLLENME
jgi:GTP-dependent phosphoenolpyruvate carboxykinase